MLKDETFMWFRSKQESLKSGWLYKKGGGLSTLSRRLFYLRPSSVLHMNKFKACDTFIMNSPGLLCVLKSKELEDALVCPEGLQADVLRQRQ